MTKILNLLGTGLVIGSFIAATLWLPLVLMYPPLYTPGQELVDYATVTVAGLLVVAVLGLSIRLANDAE